MAAQTAFGWTITFGTSSWTADITDIAVGGVSREAIETTHYGSSEATAGTFGGRTFIPAALADAGEITISCHWDPDSVPPVNGAAETVTISHNDGTTTDTTYAGSGFCTGFEYSGGDAMSDTATGTVTVKWSGLVTVTDAT